MTLSAAAYSQALFNPSNLIFEIRLPTDNSITLSKTEEIYSEEKIFLYFDR